MIGIPRDSKKGTIESLEIPRDSKMEVIGSLGIPEDSQSSEGFPFPKEPSFIKTIRL